MDHPAAPEPFAAVPEAATHMQADQYLYALAQTLRSYDGVTTTLQGNVLHIAEIGGGRTEQIKCVPRRDDGGRLWLWNSARQPVAPAGHPDAPLVVVRWLRAKQERQS